jgi:hypothetical protein
MQVIANEVTPLADAIKSNGNASANGSEKPNGNNERIHLYLRETEVSTEELVRLRDTLLDFPGRATVYLHLMAAASGETVIELPDQVRIASSPELEDRVERLFGSRVSFSALNS